MAERVRVPRKAVVRAEPQQDEAAGHPAKDQDAIDLALTDELLDEIDGLLEENAQEFIDNFVQGGGE